MVGMSEFCLSTGQGRGFYSPLEARGDTALESTHRLGAMPGRVSAQVAIGNSRARLDSVV